MKWLKTLTAMAIVTLLVMAMSPVKTVEENTGKGIEFHTGTWKEALAQAKKENKLIFLDISASWCGPCKMLKKNTFPNDEVGTFYNSNFINVAVDGEIGEGIELANKFQIEAYPSLIFVNSDGNLVAQTAGYHDAKEFLKLGQDVKAKYKQH